LKLTPHEKKILALIELHPEIITDTKKRGQIAKENGLSEKTLRNRIGDLKKYGVISKTQYFPKTEFDNNHLNKDKEDQNFISMISILKKHKKYIIFCATTSFIIGLIYAFTATPFYQSTTTMYPAGEPSNGSNILGGGLKGLADSYGIFSGLNSSPTYNIPDIVKSRKIKKNIILLNWKSKSFSDSTNLIKFWEIDKEKGFNPLKFLSSILPNKNSFEVSNSDLYLETAIEKLDELIFVNEEQSGLIIVSVLMEDPDLAADITNYIASYVKAFISIEQKKEAKKKKYFTYNQMLSAKNDLSYSESKLTDFLKKYPMALGNPDLQLEKGRLLREIEENQAVYITLRQQYEIAKIDVEEDKLFINILDEGDVAVKKSKPKRILILLSSIILGIMVGILLAIYRSKLYFIN